LYKKLNSYKLFLAIFFLGLTSGLPLSLILSTLKALLVEKGFDIKTVGFFALVTIPYSLKIFFAPIIDSYKIPLLTKLIGHRKSWIVLTQIFLALFISLLGVATIFTSLFYIAIFAVMIAFFSASQDIVIDGYRIELIKKEDQGLASGFYIYGYRLALLISGAGALALAELVSWQAVYFIMGLIMLSSIVFTLKIKETRQNFNPKYICFKSWFRKFVIVPFLDILTRRNRPYIILPLIFFFKLADAFAGNLFVPFLLDIGYTKIDIATALKTFGLFAVLFGVLFGGILVKKINILKTLWIAAIAQTISNLAFCYLAINDISLTSLYIVVFVENFSGGIGDAALVAYLSSLCNKKYSATQYALLASITTIARSLFSSTAGIFAQNLGWFKFFIFSTFLGLPVILLLFWLTISNKPIKTNKSKLINQN